MTITLGTKIKVTNTPYEGSVNNGSIMTVERNFGSWGVDATLDGGDGFVWYMREGTYEVLKDDTPTLWKDMTPEEKGALLLAQHEGKTIEFYGLLDEWVVDCNFNPKGCCNMAYRIAPHKPVVETVEVYGGTEIGRTWGFYTGHESNAVEYRITFDTIDGVPDTGSIKLVEV